MYERVVYNICEYGADGTVQVNSITLIEFAMAKREWGELPYVCVYASAHVRIDGVYMYSGRQVARATVSHYNFRTTQYV